MKAEADNSKIAKRVAVVGGCGFIGSRLAIFLAEEGIEVTAFDIRPPDDDLSKSCPVVICDTRQRTQLRGVFDEFDTVFLMAALLGKGCSEDGRAGWETNVCGTANVLNEVMHSPRRPRIIFLSSGSVYSAPAKQYPVPEEALKMPYDIYSASKWAGESMVVAACAAGLQAVILRLFTVYGDGPASAERGHFLASWLERAQVGQPLIIHGDGQQTRDFTHVSDVVRACRFAMNKSLLPGESVTYNIGSGTEVAICEIARWISQAVPKINLRYLPLIKTTSRRYIGDISRACHELSYRPLIPPEEGIKTLIRAHLLRPF